ncbi:OmpH family outer membrane protein [Maribacter sp. 2307ULW6-5]|uniref:OmpH family outer membrane protein n=1 Tax=Maribacter sp. 2307ULW6-5 TaxID=3386275 RepID=UPI0039BD79CF
MKLSKNVLVPLLAFLATLHITAQRGVRIAYVDMEYILENVEEYRDANEQLASKVEKWKVEVEQRQRQVEQMKKDLMAEKVLLTPELIEEREEDIAILERETIAYQQDRFGPQGDLVLQKARLIQPIQDQVFNEVQKIGSNKRYDFIFDKSADVVMLYSEKRHDISDQVLRAISRTRKVSKPKDNKAERNRLEAFAKEEEAAQEAELSDALKERLERAQQAQEAREKTVEERRAEQLQAREARRKAYEERRKKLLEEREAKKKEKEQQRGKSAEENEND